MRAKKTTRIIEVSGDDDFAAAVFADAVNPSEFPRLWNEAMALSDGLLSLELDGSIVHIAAHEFPHISKKFIEFSRRFQDYDGSKTHDWFVVEEK